MNVRVNSTWITIFEDIALSLAPVRCGARSLKCEFQRDNKSSHFPSYRLRGTKEKSKADPTPKLFFSGSYVGIVFCFQGSIKPNYKMTPCQVNLFEK
jgi:hypothetical protein